MRLPTEQELALFARGFSDRVDADARMLGVLAPGNRTPLRPDMHPVTLLFAWRPERITGLRQWADRLCWRDEHLSGFWSVQALEASVWARRVLRGEPTLREALRTQRPSRDEGGLLRELRELAELPAERRFGGLDAWLVRARALALLPETR